MPVDSKHKLLPQPGSTKLALVALELSNARQPEDSWHITLVPCMGPSSDCSVPSITDTVQVLPVATPLLARHMELVGIECRTRSDSTHTTQTHKLTLKQLSTYVHNSSRAPNNALRIHDQNIQNFDSMMKMPTKCLMTMSSQSSVKCDDHT